MYAFSYVDYECIRTFVFGAYEGQILGIYGGKSGRNYPPGTVHQNPLSSESFEIFRVDSYNSGHRMFKITSEKVTVPRRIRPFNFQYFVRSEIF